MRFSDLTTGHEFPPAPLTLDAETVARYLAATGDDNSIYWPDRTGAGAGAGAPEIVPPLAVAALSLRGMATSLALQPGSLHTGQELAFRRPIRVGERLTADARVAASSKRRGMAVLAIDVAVVDDIGEQAVTGRMNLLVPAAGAPDIDLGGPDLVGGRGMDTTRLLPVTYPPLSPARIVAGAELEPLARTPTQDVIDAYALASGDHNPIHIDPGFAARSQFGGTIAHGMLVLSYISAMLTRAFGPRWIDTGTLKVRFRNPALAGRPVTARGRIERVEGGHTTSSLGGKADGGDGVQYAVCAVTVENAAAEPLITGEARVHVPHAARSAIE